MSSLPGGSPHPYIPATEADRARMLERVGVADLGALFADLPQALLDPAIDLPPALTEPELIALLSERAAENADPSRPDFLGAGAYRHAIPAITSHLAGRSEFVTAYTPYQPEISQGTLQTAFEFQSVVCELTGMDISNTGLYDGASATAEACLLAARVTKRRAVALLEPIHPGTADVVRAYARGAGLRVDVLRSGDSATPDHACLVVQQPDFLGSIVDLEPLAEALHADGVLLVAVADPFALGLLRAPGDAGADIVTGEGRDLAGPPQFGGPSLGLFAARATFMRQMPGRIVGRTRELRAPANGDGGPRTGYVLTLQAREQFIRRERATSNVSTAQALIALAFTVTLQALGPRGLRESAELSYQRAHDAARRIAALDGYETPERGPWFSEFLVRGPLPAAGLAAALRARGIGPGLDVSARPEPEAKDALLFAVTEATPDAHVDALVEALSEIGAEA
ncbi:MAG: aminomethyl-transferring glycine dehydrogenase subunit GcvPA [Acidimicrobiia bacterium]|nr:aminomethyl-transferring glycine dehydrogenase subunit GcvPA [Acidimicrobiia bacterium]MYC45833.1 aminomethyl-transferring glycine dehydrogenase subunit GcvPA [Acidimicrobiia bacterium]MYI20657.1 aminomethyl-transferring glycine dehydrogenase subunit GcvPA [Acidimicrobiia bacterium]